MKSFEEVLVDAKQGAHSVSCRDDYRRFCKRATGIVREWMWEKLAVARYTVAVHHMVRNPAIQTVFEDSGDSQSRPPIERAMYADMATDPKRTTVYVLNGRNLFGPKRPVATAIAFCGPDGTTYVGGAAVDKHDQWDRVLGRWQAISTAKALTAEEVERLHGIRWADPLFDPGNRRPLDVAVLSPYHEWVAVLPHRARSAGIYCADMLQRVRDTRQSKKSIADKSEAAMQPAVSSGDDGPAVSS